MEQSTIFGLLMFFVHVSIAETKVSGVEPVIEMIPANGNLHVLRGETASLWCKITQGDPPPTVQWVKGGHNTPVGEGEELRFNPVKLEDADGYECTASNSHGSKTGSFNVNVFEYDTKEVLTGNKVEIVNPHGKNGIKLTWYNTNLMAGDSPDDKYKVAEWLVLSGNSANVKPGYDVDDKTGDLLIPSVTLDHEGWYTAFLMDPMDENKYGYTKIIVRVSGVEPVIEMIPANGMLHVLRGETASLWCKITQGDPPPTVQWVKGVNDTSVGEGEELKFDPVKLEDHDGYKCTASNHAGSKTGRFNLAVYDYETKKVDIGDEVEMINPYGKNGIKLTWYNTNHMPGDSVDDKYKVAEWLVSTGSSANVKPGYDVDDKTGNLVISSFTLDHEGWYTAFMMDPMTENKYGYTKVIVHVTIPSYDVMVEPRQSIVNVGDSVKVSCFINIDRKLDGIRWRVGEKIIYQTYPKNYPNDNQKYDIQDTDSSNVTVVVKNIKSSDKGSYRCESIAHPTYYKVSDVIIIDSIPGPTFEVTLSPRQTITELGAAPTIQCTVDLGKNADSIRWKRVDDDGISQTIFQTYPTDFDYNKDKYSIRIPKSGTVDLTIKNVRSEDGGKYICEPMVHADKGKVAELVIRL